MPGQLGVPGRAIDRDRFVDGQASPRRVACSELRRRERIQAERDAGMPLAVVDATLGHISLEDGHGVLDPPRLHEQLALVPGVREAVLLGRGVGRWDRRGRGAGFGRAAHVADRDQDHRAQEMRLREHGIPITEVTARERDGLVSELQRLRRLARLHGSVRGGPNGLDVRPWTSPIAAESPKHQNGRIGRSSVLMRAA